MEIDVLDEYYVILKFLISKVIFKSDNSQIYLNSSLKALFN